MEFFLEKSSFKKITDNQKRPIKPHAYILNFVNPHTKTLFRKGKSHTKYFKKKSKWPYTCFSSTKYI